MIKNLIWFPRNINKAGVFQNINPSYCLTYLDKGKVVCHKNVFNCNIYKSIK